jgi:thioredoxin reductase
MAEQAEETGNPDSVDVAVIGGGPAGLAAASLCARSRLSTALLDRHPAPGGHSYRLANHPVIERDSLFGKEYARGAKLIREFLASGARYLPDTAVMNIKRGPISGFVIDGGARRVQARRIILATGAIERPMPVPGADLPGVMMAGAAQGMLLAEGDPPQGTLVFAGCGPLLWLIAWQLANAGVKIAALLDTAPAGNRALARPYFFSYALSPYALKQQRLARAVRRATTVIEGVSGLRAEGEGRLQRVAFTDAGGNEHRLPADMLLLQQGITPDATLAMSLGATHLWDEQQQCMSPLLDHEGGTSVEGIAIAGDAAGIAGAQAAAWRGVLVASGVVRKLRPGPSMDPVGKLAHNALKRFMRGRKYLDLRYRPGEIPGPGVAAAP